MKDKLVIFPKEIARLQFCEMVETINGEMKLRMRNHLKRAAKKLYNKNWPGLLKTGKRV